MVDKHTMKQMMLYNMTKAQADAAARQAAERRAKQLRLISTRNNKEAADRARQAEVRQKEMAARGTRSSLPSPAQKAKKSKTKKNRW
tara:strand:+ start:554 stop:814 length:261 start_codon:yes stop_codon:yes gene_type:complete